MNNPIFSYLLLITYIMLRVKEVRVPSTKALISESTAEVPFNLTIKVGHCTFKYYSMLNQVIVEIQLRFVGNNQDIL